MTITANEIYLLNNHAGKAAHQVQLGTLIYNAENVVAGEIALADGKILVGGATGVAAAQTMSGDVSISNTGVAAIGAGVIINNDVKSDAAIAYSKLAALATGSILLGVADVATVTDIKADKGILIGNGTTAAVQQVSGDVTISNLGVVAIGAGKVLESMLSVPEGNVLNAKRTWKGTFTFSDGATSGSYNVGAVLPDNAVITRSWVDVTTTFAGNGDDTSTIAITSGEAANDIVSAVAIKDGGNPWDAGIHEGVSTGTAANMKKLTAAHQPQVVVAIAATDTALVAGSMAIFIEYVVSN